MVVSVKQIKEIIYNIEIEKDIDARLVHISDLHYFHKKNIMLLDNILERIKKLEPNYICITGDFLDDDIKEIDPFLKWLRRLKNISPVILSVGNHDVGNVHLRTENFFNNFKKINQIPNVYLLDNQEKRLGRFYFRGVTVSDIGYHETKDGNKIFENELNKISFSKIDTHYFNVLMIHSPYLAVIPEVWNLSIFKDSDIILSGHTHGGLTPQWLYELLGNRSLITPKKRILRKYGRGYHPEYHLIINSAIKKLAHSSRIEWLDRFTSSEITVININKNPH